MTWIKSHVLCFSGLKFTKNDEEDILMIHHSFVIISLLSLLKTILPFDANQFRRNQSNILHAAVSFPVW